MGASQDCFVDLEFGYDAEICDVFVFESLSSNSLCELCECSSPIEGELNDYCAMSFSRRLSTLFYDFQVYEYPVL